MPGNAGEEDFLDGVPVALDLPVDDGLERRLFRHGPEAVGDEYLLAHLLSADRPTLHVRRRSPGKVAVEVLGFAKPAIGRRLAALRLSVRAEQQDTNDTGQESRHGCSLVEAGD